MQNFRITDIISVSSLSAAINDDSQQIKDLSFPSVERLAGDGFATTEIRFQPFLIDFLKGEPSFASLI